MMEKQFYIFVSLILVAVSAQAFDWNEPKDGRKVASEWIDAWVADPEQAERLIHWVEEAYQIYELSLGIALPRFQIPFEKIMEYSDETAFDTMHQFHDWVYVVMAEEKPQFSIAVSKDEGEWRWSGASSGIHNIEKALKRWPVETGYRFYVVAILGVNLRFLGVVTPEGEYKLMPEFIYADKYFGYLHDDDGLYPLLSYQNVFESVLDKHPNLRSSIQKEIKSD